MTYSPYNIPYLPASIAFSGGRTSGYMLYKLLQKYDFQLPDQVYVVFENTGEECEETYQFIHEIEQRWCPVIWLEYDDWFDIQDFPEGSNKRIPPSHRQTFKIVNFETASRDGTPFTKHIEYLREYRRVMKGLEPTLPGFRQRSCTGYLKIQTANKYIASLGYSDYDSYVGIRYDEPRRFAGLKAVNESNFINMVRTPLISARITKQDVLRFWKKQPFDLQLDPDGHEGNCRYCFMKKMSIITRIMRERMQKNNGQPDAEILRWVERERSTGKVFRVDRPPLQELVQIAISEMEIKESPDDVGYDCFCGDPGA